MKARKILALLFACLLVVSCFAACGKPAETTDEGTKTPETVDTTPLNDRLNEKDTVPTDLKYDSETVTFFVRNDQDIYKYELACEEIKNDALYDAVHYRNIDVENRLGVKIKTVDQNGSWLERDAWNNILMTSVLTNSDDFDGAAFYVSAGSPMAKDGIFYNLMNLEQSEEAGYLNFSKPWWNQSMVDELTIYGSLFFVGGDILVSDVADTFCMFFNKDMFDERFPGVGCDGLYQTIFDGNWTIDKMQNYVSQVWEDVNQSGKIDDGDTVGLFSNLVDSGGFDGWLYALGLNITEKDEYGIPYYTLLSDPQLVPAFEACKALNNSTGTFLSKTHEETGADKNNSMFTFVMIKNGANFRNYDFDYSVLPLPKYNEEQDDYRTTICTTASVISICSNVSDERAAMVSAVLELLAAESYKNVTPAYYSKVLKGHYSQNENDSKMYDIILESVVFDFAHAYSTLSLSSIGSLFRDMSPTFDLQNTLDSKTTVWNTKLEELLGALEAIS